MCPKGRKNYPRYPVDPGTRAEGGSHKAGRGGREGREGEERGKQASKTHHDWQEAKRLVADAAYAERLALMRTCKSKSGERGARFFTAQTLQSLPSTTARKETHRLQSKAMRRCPDALPRRGAAMRGGWRDRGLDRTWCRLRMHRHMH